MAKRNCKSEVGQLCDWTIEKPRAGEAIKILDHRTRVEVVTDWDACVQTLTPSSFPGAAIINDHRLGDLKKKFILAQLWRPEAQNTDVSRAVLPLKDLVEILFLAFSILRWLQTFFGLWLRAPISFSALLSFSLSDISPWSDVFSEDTSSSI